MSEECSGVYFCGDRNSNKKSEPPLVYCIDFTSCMVEGFLDDDYLISSWLDGLTDIEFFFLLQTSLELYEEGDSVYAKDLITLVGMILSETFDDVSNITDEDLEQYVDIFTFIVIIEAMKRDGKVDYKPFGFKDKNVEYWYVKDVYKEMLCSSMKDFFDEHKEDSGKEIKNDDKKDKK